MKKSAIIFLTSLIVLLLVGKATFADENGRGNEEKNENGAQVTTEGEFKIVENNNRIIIKIKTENENSDHGKSDEDNDDHKNEHGRDVDDEDENDDDDDDDNSTISPTPSPEISVTPTETPTVTPTITPTENPTITPTVAPTGTQQQVSIDAKIKGTFASVDQFMTFLENLINTIKSALTPTS